MTRDHHFYDATQACWAPIFRRLAVAEEPRTVTASLRLAWQRFMGTAHDPMEPPLGDPARNIYSEAAPLCTRCGAKFQPRPAGSAHPATWRVCRSCAEQALAAARGRRRIRRGMRLVETSTRPAPAATTIEGAESIAV
jgi:hypothetical protein